MTHLWTWSGDVRWPREGACNIVTLIDYISSRVSDIKREARWQEKDALDMYGMLEGSDPWIFLLRHALVVWSLSADDIGVLLIHGTSTGANVSYCRSCHIIYYLLTRNHRKIMRLTSGTISSHPFLTRLVIQSHSWCRRVFSVTRKEALHPGKWPK